jgi:hypothetical protein
MAAFSYTVDTNEMAHSIDAASHNVQGVTAAVAAMQAAVIAADTAAANRVCEHVDRGFFLLIRSQISQKLARLRSSVDSHLMEMRQQNQALGLIRSRMERDYQMIATRYGRLFRSIDLSLRNRIFELDKPVCTLVSRDVERLLVRSRALQAQTPVYQIESVQSAQLVAAAATKGNAKRAILAMRGFIEESKGQAGLVDSMLFADSAEAQIVYAPVMLFETDGTAGGTQWDVRTPKSAAPIAAAVEKVGRESGFSDAGPELWASAGRESASKIAEEFRRMLERSSLHERVKQRMLGMFDASPWQTLQRQTIPGRAQ